MSGAAEGSGRAAAQPMKFTGKKRLDLCRACVLQRFEQRLLGLLHDIGVSLGFAHLNEFGVVADGGFEPLYGADLGIQFVALLHDRARFVGIGPEVGVLGTGVEIV